MKNKTKELEESTFRTFLDLDPEFKTWIQFADSWIKTKEKAIDPSKSHVKFFFRRYLYDQNITKDPAKFLSINFEAPNLFEICFDQSKITKTNIDRARSISSFINWVLINYFSVENDSGEKQIIEGYHNSIEAFVPSKSIWALKREDPSPTYGWLLKLDSDFEIWSQYATKWIETPAAKIGRQGVISGINKFFEQYLYEQHLPKDPQVFLSTNFDAPDFLEIGFGSKKTDTHSISQAKKVILFINWVLENYFSVENDSGEKKIIEGYHNPIQRYLPISCIAKYEDRTFRWVLNLNPDFEEWRKYAERWHLEQLGALAEATNCLSKFFDNYLFQQNITANPCEFLSTSFVYPSFYESCIKANAKNGIELTRKLSAFIDWVLINYFSVEDDLGNKLIPREYHNPIKKSIPTKKASHYNESNKNVLPFRFVKELRSMICPDDATSFCDWKLAQSLSKSCSTKGSWILVDRSVIDENDTDCVWKQRKSTINEKKIKGYGDYVYEIWSPVSSVALYIKLLLPLRTYQVRMLDSGEADTYIYQQPFRQEAGYWTENNGVLKKGTKKHPMKRGVFRQFEDTITKQNMTGFFVNTNKTADIDKDEHQKGYEIPWQYEEALYWLSKLRNWQHKYNPITKLVPWTKLKRKHLGAIKNKSVLSSMGETAFLFRNPSAQNEEHLPLTDATISSLWIKLLSVFEENINAIGNSKIEKNLKFVYKPIDTKHKGVGLTYYPLHSLRVSLITAYALEGGVPMSILSKAIAGHARLVMTLYYTKAGISYVTDKMTEAENNILENEKETYQRFLRDATYDQLETSSAINDPIAYQTIIDSQKFGANIIKGDLGICPKSNFGCDTGGIYEKGFDGKIVYGVVPGYPEQNCVRCRWFITGPAFLPGLVHHFNAIGYNMSETGKRIIEFEKEIHALEDLKYDCDYNDQLFTEHAKLLKMDNLCNQEIQKNDKWANDYNATLRLIQKCMSIIEKNNINENLQLITVGTLKDIQLSLNNADNELEQIQTICNGAEIFPSTDASKAILQRSQIIDLTLAQNNKKPVMFYLTEKEQLIAGNQWMRLLINRCGNLKDAVPYAIGLKKLEEIGFVNEFDEEIESVQFKKDSINFERSKIKALTYYGG
ncbi:gamma-mobile-trio integrase GmtZ [Acetobacterium malicum]|uniref:gamma-mobile-trio integrase GmtZ n=1 Tax=Acetobacterium malicum TaxID=52692 RepID=UPI003593A5A6